MAGNPPEPGVKRLTVGIIFGGRSREHEVSLASAASVIQAMDRGRFEPVPIGIGKDGRWLIGGDPLRSLAQASGVALPLPESSESRAIPATTAPPGSLPPRLAGEIEVFFPLIHGPFGEDGTLQGLLELAGVPYVGAGVLASAVGMDKAVQKALLLTHGIPITEHLVVQRYEWDSDPDGVVERVSREIGFPCFVKPSNLGSSVGISKVKTRDALSQAMEEAARHDRKLLVERAVTGREIEVAVLGNDDPKASVTGEVIPEKEWYDYEAKYTPGLTRFVIPAPIPREVSERARALALQSFKALDASGMARVDFFLEDESLIFNEINTIPGFTSTSGYPRLWAASGIAYPELITRLIELALERHADKLPRGA
jgi:D-alanine-D-alanine ligase